MTEHINKRELLSLGWKTQKVVRRLQGCRHCGPRLRKELRQRPDDLPGIVETMGPLLCRVCAPLARELGNSVTVAGVADKVQASLDAHGKPPAS